MNYKNKERTLLKDNVFNITNKSFSFVDAKHDTQTCDINDIKIVKEYSHENFDLIQSGFLLLVLSALILNVSLLNNTIEIQIIDMIFSGYSRHVFLIASIIPLFLIFEKIIKPLRYLSIKLKNGKEAILYSPLISLIRAENAWNESSQQSFYPNRSTDFDHIVITKNSFSVAEKFESRIMTDEFHDVFNTGYVKKWRSFKISNIMNISEPTPSNSFLNKYGFISILWGTVITAFAYMLFGMQPIAVIFLSQILLSFGLIKFKRYLEFDDLNIHVELKDGSCVLVPGSYNSFGVSQTKIALDKAIFSH